MRAGIVYQHETKEYDAQAVMCICPETVEEEEILKGMLTRQSRPDLAGVHQFIAIIEEDRLARTIQLTLLASETEA